MNWLTRLERRLGFLAVPGLGRTIVGLQVLCFALGLADEKLLSALVLDPAAVAGGEFWRLFTFLAVPTLSPLNVLFSVFYFFFQWTVFEALEAEWGAFRLTLYCALGWFCAAALPMGAHALSPGQPPLLSSGGWWAVSIQLAFATHFPDFRILVYFVLPVKMRWVAWGIAGLIAYQILTAPAATRLGEAALVAFGLLNYLLFFGASLLRAGLRAGRNARDRQAFEKSKRRAVSSLPARACRRCGAGPEAELRLCTCPRCGEEGLSWCREHLGEHLQEPAAQAAAPRRKPSPEKKKGKG